MLSFLDQLKWVGLKVYNVANNNLLQVFDIVLQVFLQVFCNFVGQNMCSERCMATTFVQFASFFEGVRRRPKRNRGPQKARLIKAELTNPVCLATTTTYE